MIICEDISYSYGKEKPILCDINIHIARGSFIFLTGASGSGKSSLLNLLSLAVRPNKGKITFFGEETTNLSVNELPFLRRKIGIVFQEFKLLNHLTVAENVALPLKIAGDNSLEIYKKTTQMLDWIGLADFKNSYPKSLSGGQKQRVAIARAVASNPPLLLADEPSGNLDADLSYQLMYLFESLNKMGTTVIFATHDEYLINNFNHKVINISNGTVAR